MNTWSATALNTAPDSENRIHSDELARQYGFEGGLVPGVTISAYLVHPLIEQWGKNWLDRGYANCRITSPLYDNERFDVKTDIVDGDDRPELLGQMIDLNQDPPIASKAMTNGTRTPAPLGVAF